MQATEGEVGRVFVLRLEDGDRVPEVIEKFAAARGLRVAQAIFVGGVGGGAVVVGPRQSTARPPEPMCLPVDGAHEVAAVGLIAPDEAGRPVLHMHAALGRAGKTTTGCIRPGVETWLVGEVVLVEIKGAAAVRRPDPESGFALLRVEGTA